MPRVKIESMCHNELVNEVGSPLEKAAHTGPRGDEKIYVMMQCLDHLERKHHPTKVLGLISFLSCLVLLRPFASADGNNTYADLTLRGLQGMGVVGEHINPDAERDGLTKKQLQTDVELRLRKAGIMVLPRVEWSKTPGLPYLYVRVATSKNPYNFYAIAIHVELWQAVLLMRDPTITTMAPTWTARGTIGSVGTDRMHAVRDVVGDDVDEFIKDYLAMNPRREQGDVERYTQGVE